MSRRFAITGMRDALFLMALVAGPLGNIWGWGIRPRSAVEGWRRPVVLVGLLGGTVAIGLFWMMVLAPFSSVSRLDLNVVMEVAGLGSCLSIGASFTAKGELRLALIASGVSSLLFWLLVGIGV